MCLSTWRRWGWLNRRKTDQAVTIERRKDAQSDVYEAVESETKRLRLRLEQLQALADHRRDEQHARRA